MNHAVYKTLHFARFFGVVLTLLAMLFVSSAQGAIEDSSEELVSQEIEMVMGRREQPRSETRGTLPGSFRRIPQASDHAASRRDRFFVVSKERENLNGFGTHLRV